MNQKKIVSRGDNLFLHLEVTPIREDDEEDSQIRAEHVYIRFFSEFQVAECDEENSLSQKDKTHNDKIIRVMTVALISTERAHERKRCDHSSPKSKDTVHSRHVNPPIRALFHSHSLFYQHIQKNAMETCELSKIIVKNM